jgi:baseplate hub protein gp41
MSTPSNQLAPITVESKSTAGPVAPGTQQYGRKLSLVIATDSGAGIELSEFRVVFHVMRGDLQNPNQADIRVYNLSRATANKLAAAEFTQLALQAGYPGNFGLIFQGTITQARIGRESQTDSYVDFTAADGDEAYNFATIAASMSAGVNASQRALATLLQSMKDNAITQGYTPPLSTNGNVRGRVFYGPTRDELRTFARNNDCIWSIQDGKLTMIPQTSYIAGDIPIISPNTGLIGVPEQTQNGLSVRVLLNPSIKIGQAIKLTDTTINQLRLSNDIFAVKDNLNSKDSTRKLNAQGLYYVMVANHSGDTRGNDWYTDMTCLAIDATVPVSDSFLAGTTANGEAIRRW